MAPHWDIAVHPAPAMMTFDNLTSSLNPDGNSVYITSSNLHLLHDIPGIPSDYQFAQLADRVVYVTGLPLRATSHNIEILFGSVGRVTVAPALVALQTMHTFRWVVFDEAEGATNAIKKVNGEVIEGTEIRVVMALPPNRVVSVNQRAEKKLGIWKLREDDEATPRVSQTHFFAYSPSGKSNDSVVTKDRLPSIESTTTIEEKPGTRQFSFGTENDILSLGGPSQQVESQLPITPKINNTVLGINLGNIARPRAESNISSITLPSVNSVDPVDVSLTTASVAVASFSTSPVTDAYSSTPAPISWANIAGRNRPDATLIELQTRKRRSLRLNHRIPSIGSIRSVDANAEPIADQKRVILLLNLPNNISLKNISDAVREGSLVRIVFGINDEDKTRYAGIIFQKATHAADFYYILQRERELSRPDRFRFIIDVCVGEPFPANDEIRAMDYPTYATRRLTIVKAGFFFMFKEEHLRRLCAKLVSAENIQLIWLYNGGNATVVFADVGSAIKVKAELERKAAMAGKSNGEPEVWAGLVTTFSKDPSLLPLDNLKTTLHD